MHKYFEIIKKLWIILKPFHKHFYVQFVLILFLQILTISVVTTVSKVITFLTEKNFSYAIFFVVFALLIEIFIQIVFYFKDRHEYNNLAQWMYQHLQEFSLKKILGMNISQLTEDHSHFKLSVMNKGESAAETIINNILLNILPVFIFVFLSFCYLFYISPIIAVWNIFIGIILLAWMIKFNKDLHPLRKKNNDNWDEQTKIRGEIFQHLLLVKYFGKEIDSIKRYIRDRKKVVEFGIFVWLKNVSHYTKRNSIMSAGEYTGTAIAVYLFYTGQIKIGTVYLIFNLSSRMLGQITSLVRQMRMMPIRFIEVEKYLNTIEAMPIFNENSKIKFSSGDIVFKDVSFKYPKGEIDAFKNLSFTIEQGRRVAFVGHSGSGKSTIIKLLLRAYEYEGSIKIDNKELKGLDAVSLRNHIGYVEQHVDLFDTTVRENILFGVDEKNKKKANKELEKVARLARIDEFYHRLGDQKFETVIGEKGIKLSGGERQRMGIARAIIKNPEILIFDEATSSLDTENEKFVVEAINNVSQGKTTIVVAHRLSTIVNADKIFVMSRGKIVGEGTHNELINNCEEYKNLVNNQIIE